jgi:hypothetical protein
MLPLQALIRLMSESQLRVGIKPPSSFLDTLRRLAAKSVGKGARGVGGFGRV